VTHTKRAMQIDDLPSYTVVVCATNHPELLDRAVWRRFQLRLELPTPSKAQMLDWLTRVGVTAEAIGLAPNRLATQLEGASFAEAEEFLLDVKRKLVLSGERSARPELTRRLLNAWKNRFASKAAVDGGQDGREWHDSADPAG
jgi:SpoVK/Ycf46/Vps4 family AAA+-type ATPase